MYEYKARIIKVVDGDTVWVEVDLGLDIKQRICLRLFGIDAPEMSTPKGIEAKDYLSDVLASAPHNITIETIKDKREKYGRYLAHVFINTEVPGREPVWVNEALVDAGHATDTGLQASSLPPVG